MTRKQLFILAIVYSFFVIVLMTANDIVLSIPWKNLYSLRTITTNETGNFSAELKSRVDSFNQNQDILSTVEFSGWSFFPSEQKNPDKKIKLVFASENDHYEVDTELQERFDLMAILRENKVFDYKHGFMTKFSPIKMKNGVYKLFIYCYENEETSGIVDTGQSFLKDYNSFTEYSVSP